MQDPKTAIWKQWQARLQQMQISDFTAMILEAAGPLNLVGAQLVYFGQPVFRGLLPAGQLDALASLLEDPKSVAQFVQGLRQDGSIEELA